MQVRKKKTIIAIIIIATAIIYLIIFLGLNNWNSAVKKEMAIKYPNAEYIVQSREYQEGKVIFHCITKDEYQILFDVSCTWGNYLTPMGPLPFPERYCLINLDEKICEKVAAEAIGYDVSGKMLNDDQTLDGIMEYLNQVYGQAESLCGYYGFRGVPKIVVPIRRNGKDIPISYSGSEHSYYREYLREELGQEDSVN